MRYSLPIEIREKSKRKKISFSNVKKELDASRKKNDIA